jgi:nucleoside 2-deoxyribosyltransferase
MEKAFHEIDTSDQVLFFVNSPEVSQGMLMELGYAIARKKRLVLAIREDIRDSIFRRHIDDVIEFKDVDDLQEKLEKHS